LVINIDFFINIIESAENICRNEAPIMTLPYYSEKTIIQNEISKKAHEVIEL
jgi:hypothetical protein